MSSAITRWSFMAPAEMRHRFVVLRFRYFYAGSDARWDPRPNVMKIEGEPEKVLCAGDPLVLDGVFPITWARARAQV